jgi:hypothetical protein
MRRALLRERAIASEVRWATAWASVSVGVSGSLAHDALTGRMGLAGCVLVVVAAACLLPYQAPGFPRERTLPQRHPTACRQGR